MSSNTFVPSFTHLKDKPNADKALEMLKKIASLVKPIMRKHGWVLPVLSEFFPDQQNLLGLNVNMGQNILVRLRPAHSPDWFLPLEEVVQTMLHELTHNVHGPHDDKFYKFLAGLQDEYDALQRSGYAGEGFYSEGRRLGISVSHNVPQHMARSKALEAAEKRLQTSRVLGSGGRLGGATRNSNLSPRELAARAAEQRLRDEKSCASGAVARREAEKAAQESVESKVIDLTLDDDDDYPVVGSDDDIIIVKDVHPKQGVSANSSRVKSQIPKTLSSGPVRSLKPQNQSTSKSSNKSDDLRSKPYPVRPKQPHPTKSSTAEWSCSTCTLLNAALALQCDACGMRKPLDRQAGWTCLACGEAGNLPDLWSCKWCREIKVQS